MNSLQLPKFDKILCPICYSLNCKIKAHHQRQVSADTLHFFYCHNCSVKFASYDPVYDCPECGSNNQVVMVM